MADQKHTHLFREFPPNTMQEWMDKVTADLKGADFTKKLVWKTNEGFSVQPMYRLENMQELHTLTHCPGEFPFVRGNKKEDNDWLVRQDIQVKDALEANRKALEILNRGVDSLGFHIANGEEFSKAEMMTLLKEIHLESVEVNFVVHRNKTNVLELFREVVADRGIDPARVRGAINIDPIGKLVLEGVWSDPEPLAIVADALKSTAAFTALKPLEVGGYVFSNSGSSIVQELGFSLAAGVAYLDRLTDLGLAIDEIAPRMRFHFATGSKYFMEIAKLRAARFLWAHIVKAYNPLCDCACKMNIHAETSEWNKTVYDPNVNMLRTQTEAMSAVLGGVDSFTVHPYDYVYECQPSELGERVARNQQLLLKEESHFGKVVDAAGGSYYIEELTQSIADAAWKLFLEVQEKGGFIQALEAGFVQNSVNETARKRDLAIATRKENLLGTNQFPNFGETLNKPMCNCVFEPEDHTAPNATIETLKPYRGAQAFELMRRKTDTYALAQGKRPVAYMLPIGNLTMRKARAQFACNFFACAGFEVIDNNGFATVAEGVDAAMAHKAGIVVLCSSDEEYATLAPEVFAALKGRAILVIAGAPECKPELEAAGIVHFISVKSNVLEDLTRLQEIVGIN